MVIFCGIWIYRRLQHEGEKPHNICYLFFEKIRKDARWIQLPTISVAAIGSELSVAESGGTKFSCSHPFKCDRPMVMGHGGRLTQTLSLRFILFVHSTGQILFGKSKRNVQGRRRQEQLGSAPSRRKEGKASQSGQG